MKNTPLTDIHINLGAKMAEFAGYNMPISYAGIKEEHLTVRSGVGVFDVSHMGEFILKGKNATRLIQNITTNDVSTLEPGHVQYTCMPNGNGGIVDDLLIYRLPNDGLAEDEQAYLLVVNASNIEKDWNWISQHNHLDVEMINTSDNTGLLAIQGPKAAEALQSLTDIKLNEVKYYTFLKGTFAGIPDTIISATGYTGAGGFEIYVSNDHLVQLWNTVFEAGKDYGIQPIGLGARDTLRLEMGFCLYGNDIDDTTSPIEAGLGWITKLNKGEFIDCELYKSQKENGTARKLVGFKLDDRRVPRHGYLITDADGNKIGEVTSGTQSPSLGCPIGMGYVQKEFSKADTPIFIDFNGKRLQAAVTKLPFYKES